MRNQTVVTITERKLRDICRYYTRDYDDSKKIVHKCNTTWGHPIRCNLQCCLGHSEEYIEDGRNITTEEWRSAIDINYRRE